MAARTNNHEIVIYYNRESSSDRKTVAFAQSTGSHIRSYTYDKAPSTSTGWQTILSNLDMLPKEILNKAHPEYQAKIKGKEFYNQGWMSVIQNNPHLIKAPIAMKGNKAVLCINPTDIYRL